MGVGVAVGGCSSKTLEQNSSASPFTQLSGLSYCADIVSPVRWLRTNEAWTEESTADYLFPVSQKIVKVVSRAQEEGLNLAAPPNQWLGELDRTANFFLAASNRGQPLISQKKLAEYREALKPSLDKAIEVCTADIA